MTAKPIDCSDVRHVFAQGIMQRHFTFMSLNMRKNSGSPCLIACPVRVTADVIEHKWVTLIVRELLGGKKRFSALLRSLDSISAKVLSERLRELESKRLVVKHLYATVPPTSEYELSEIGYELEVVIRAMDHVGKLLMEANDMYPDDESTEVLSEATV